MGLAGRLTGDEKLTRLKWLRRLLKNVEEVEDKHLGTYNAFLFTLALGLEPKLIYEVGVSIGSSTNAFLMALKRSGGRLVSCDVQDEWAGSVIDPDLLSRWTFVHAKSHDFAQTLTEKADLIYIDGAHNYSAVRQDVIDMWPLLKVGGYMVLHDTLYMPEGPGKVFRAMRDQCGEAVEMTFSFGFGIIHRLKDDPAQLKFPER